MVSESSLYEYLKSEQGVEVVNDEVPVLHFAPSVFDGTENHAVLVRSVGQGVELSGDSRRRQTPRVDASEKRSEQMRHEKGCVVH